MTATPAFYSDSKKRIRIIPTRTSHSQGSTPAYLCHWNRQGRPTFLIDENLPFYLEDVLRRHGYRALHVSKIFPRGTSDNRIKDYAETHNCIILTRDTISFPEPKEGGDRVVIKDFPREATVYEVLKRIKSLGW